MRWVICYDISDDKMRRKIAKLLEDHGIRIQESVFIADTSKSEMQTVQKWFNEMLRDEEDTLDSIHIYPLCEKCWQKSWRLGMVSGLESVIII